MTLSGHSEYVFDASFSPDSSILATAGQDGTVRIWDLTLSGVSEWFAFAGHSDNIYRLSLTQIGRYLATASADGAAKVWDLDSRKEILALTRHGGPLFSVSLSPDGNLLATVGYDNVAKIWKLNLDERKASAEPQLSLTGYATDPKVGGLFPGLRQLSSAPFSPNGRLLATASDGPNPQAKIWDAATGAQISTFSGQAQSPRIWDLAFSSDGERVATGAFGGDLRIWFAKTGQEPLNLVGHTGMVFGLDFSPDGKYVLAKSRLTRGFTPAECLQYLHQKECPAR